MVHSIGDSFDKSLEKEEEKLKETIFPCISWSIENKMCRCRYNLSVSQKYEHFHPSIEDLDKECKGLSNMFRCVAFRELEVSMVRTREQLEEREDF